MQEELSTALAANAEHEERAAAQAAEIAGMGGTIAAQQAQIASLGQELAAAASNCDAARAEIARLTAAHADEVGKLQEERAAAVLHAEEEAAALQIPLNVGEEAGRGCGADR